MFPKKEDLGILQPIIGPWYESLEDPEKAQRSVLKQLIQEYKKTDYGKDFGAQAIMDRTSYQTNFPIIDYEGLVPHLALAREGNYRAILSEPPECWVMTRGSTGRSKVLPATKGHLKQIFSCGARALINYALRKENFDLFAGGILNLNFPSLVHKMVVKGQEINYGYSSGTYARINPMFNRVSILPRQEEIDELGSGITKGDWNKRFEFVYQRALNEKITAIMGVTPVALAFAKYVKREHGKTPGEIWRFQALFCTSVRKIQFKYAPTLKKYFGRVPVVEMYTATEGAFAQQLDDLPYVTPNYDAYLFEVLKGKSVKMLHELRRGEWGRLIVSSRMFPRYDIGDMVEAAGKNYFRIFGRRSFLTLLEHRLYRLFWGWFL